MTDRREEPATELARRRDALTVKRIRALGVPPLVHSDFELTAAILWDRSTDGAHGWDLLWYDRRVLINVVAWIAGEREALPASLDVERTTEAMRNGFGLSRRLAEDHAAIFIAEYARLSSQPSSGPAQGGER